MSAVESTMSLIRVSNRLCRLLRDLLVLVRPSHWVKNVLVVPIVLVEVQDWDWATLSRLAGPVAAFLLVSSLGYVLNDVGDRARDRLHPGKRLRPIAAGRIGVPGALACSIGLALALAATVLSTVPLPLCWPIPAYLCLTV